MDESDAGQEAELTINGKPASSPLLVTAIAAVIFLLVAGVCVGATLLIVFMFTAILPAIIIGAVALMIVFTLPHFVLRAMGRRGFFTHQQLPGGGVLVQFNTDGALQRRH